MREEKKKYNKDKYADFERDEDFMDKQPKDAQIPDNLEDEDEEEESDEDSDSDVLGIDSTELPEGEEKDDTFVAVGADEDEAADDFDSDDENMLDDSISEDKDEF